MQSVTFSRIHTELRPWSRYSCSHTFIFSCPRTDASRWRRRVCDRAEASSASLCHLCLAGSNLLFPWERELVMLSRVIQQEHCCCLTSPPLFPTHTILGWTSLRPAGCSLWGQSICGNFDPWDFFTPTCREWWGCNNPEQHNLLQRP